MAKSWRQRNNGAGYEIQQFRQDENFCRIQAGEHVGVYVRQYEAEKKEEGEREMINTNLMFSSKSDDWETPQYIFDELDSEFHFTLDPCATVFNHK